MASITKSAFIAELKSIDEIIEDLSDSVVSSFIDQALRAFSKKMPYAKVDADNTVVDGAESYDLPADCHEVTDVVESTTKTHINFNVFDEGSGQKLFLGSIYVNVLDELMDIDFYNDISSQSSNSGLTSYSAFDIRYVVLQTITTIADTYLEAIGFYVEYLAYKRKASGIALAATELTSDNSVTRITDSDQGGNFSVEFDKPANVKKALEDSAGAALDKFNAATNFPYMIRG